MATLFKRFCRAPMYGRRPLLTIGQVLAWADAHHAATGRWPTIRTPGPIRHSPFGETWCAIDALLLRGSRGLPQGFSLARLIHKYRGVKPRLTDETTRRRSELHRRLGPRVAMDQKTGIRSLYDEFLRDYGAEIRLLGPNFRPNSTYKPSSTNGCGSRRQTLHRCLCSQSGKPRPPSRIAAW
jgi:hypothetical protein